jgi:hypothetical protein
LKKIKPIQVFTIFVERVSMTDEDNLNKFLAPIGFILTDPEENHKHGAYAYQWNYSDKKESCIITYLIDKRTRNLRGSIRLSSNLASTNYEDILKMTQDKWFTFKSRKPKLNKIARKIANGEL